MRLTVFLCLLLAATARADVDYTVDGLDAPAEIIIDRWGVPHIYAGTHYDAFFVQGFNAARDRLWQIDLWRRRGLGQLAEAFGSDYVEQDKAARLFLYRGDMYREWLAYGSDAKRIAEAFTAGVNAYIDLLDKRPDLLPPEFALLDYRPEKWTPADVVRIRGHGLWRNVSSEVRRARIACDGTLEQATYWQPLEPAWETRIPAGLDPCDIPDDVLETYYLAKAPVSFSGPEDAVALAREAARDRSLGSNNWVVAPRRTATGRPILADDPHRSHAVPSLRYIAHLVAPDLNVIGAGEPALPGISIGHNERIAFGLTIFSIDQEDLYVYERDGDGYRYDGGTESVKAVTETIAVRGDDDVDVTLRFTRHGPVVATTDEHLFAVRAAWLDAGMAPYFGSVEYMRAQNWREFLAALNRWGAPSENQVYADIDGNIGYKPAGLFPRRPGWDGLLPVPGDGRYEWDGYYDMDVLPVEYNPARGFTGTANSMNLPEDYPIEQYPMGLEWTAPWRYRRLWEVLEDQDSHTIEDSLALQRDYESVLARRLVEHVPPAGDSPAAALLRDWNGVLAPDSAAAALYNVWLHRHLEPSLAAMLVPDDPLRVAPLDTRGILRLLTEERSDAVVRRTLAAAWEETRELLGDDPSAWRWGDLHRMRFEHPLLAYASGELREQMTYPDYARGGSGYTTNSTAFRPADFLVRSGASFRMVLDVGNWDAARMTSAPGQSGDPASPFYDNLLEGWATDGSFPLLYSREAILENAVLTIRLAPR
ncbi:MAG: penicillin acylase family protein [Woeseiaceae bacterium]|nr:penicillin acylase family protein [Woeseiaceae bacterium]